MVFLFQRLDVYRRAISLADRVDRVTRTFKRGNRPLADQLQRAIISIPANIAEGNGRFTPGERIQFFGIARGSAYECVALIELAERRTLIPDFECASITSELDELCRMLNGLIRSTKERGRSH